MTEYSNIKIVYNFMHLLCVCVCVQCTQLYSMDEAIFHNNRFVSGEFSPSILNFPYQRQRQRFEADMMKSKARHKADVFQ